MISQIIEHKMNIYQLICHFVSFLLHVPLIPVGDKCCPQVLCHSLGNLRALTSVLFCRESSAAILGAAGAIVPA